MARGRSTDAAAGQGCLAAAWPPLVERAMARAGLSVTGLGRRLGSQRKHLSNILAGKCRWARLSPSGSRLALELDAGDLSILRHDGVVPRPLDEAAAGDRDPGRPDGANRQAGSRADRELVLDTCAVSRLTWGKPFRPSPGPSGVRPACQGRAWCRLIVAVEIAQKVLGREASASSAAAVWFVGAARQVPAARAATGGEAAALRRYACPSRSIAILPIAHRRRGARLARALLTSDRRSSPMPTPGTSR